MPRSRTDDLIASVVMSVVGLVFVFIVIVFDLSAWWLLILLPALWFVSRMMDKCARRE